MFKVRVIPCLDVKDGRVVKGVNFVNLRDAGDPVEAAVAYDAAGADELTFLDITASHENRGIILDVVRRTAEACCMPVTVGGGVRTVEDIRALLRAGADKVSINTAAVSRRAFVQEAAEKFGDQCIVVAIDAKKVSRAGQPDRWEIFTYGGRNPTGLDAVAYAREVVELGAGEILLTSMDRDGTQVGFDLDLTRAVADAVAVPDPHSRVFDQGAPIVIRRRAKVGVARPSPCAAAAVEISVPRAHSRLRRGPGASSRLSTPIYREHQCSCLGSHRERRLPERRTIPIFSSPTVARRAALWRDQATPGEQSGRCLPPPHFFGLISLGARRTQRR